ncbi:MAG TPA: alpha-L-fucosidase [Candidatus Lokiarchaeia archaeon]|nr:alpha-L-fucosidase [Candidatus Lokiarchaeia archaeon]
MSKKGRKSELITEEDIHKISQDTGYSKDMQAYREWLESNPLPVPSERLTRWLDLEIGMFAHFSINTFHDLEWSDGTLDPATFDPTELDCKQWVKVAQELGAGYIVMTAKHHDGFCLWPTETTEYSIKSSPWKGGNGDVVKEFLDACKEASMLAGLYLSPWDRHEPCYADKEAYDDFYARQLTELCTWYDTKFVELWFDGAGSTGREYDWQSIMSIVRERQPQAIVFNMGDLDIRWAGNEDGHAPYPLWNVINRNEYGGLREGKPEYFWLPAEADKPIRYHTWFYNTNNEMMVSSVEELAASYIQSVGRGANLILNIAPDRRGLIPDVDAIAANEFGNAMRKIFSMPVACTSGQGNIIDLTLPGEEPFTFNCIVTQEDITQGQRVIEYMIESEIDEEWSTVVTGSSIGRKKIDLVTPMTTSSLRLRISKYFAEPIIMNFAAYSAPEFNEYRSYIFDNNS